RLQVEHPVTECITGQDLVEWQLRVASGQPLPLAQDQIPLIGHAIEARVCAEDPADGFRPGAGLILEFGLLQPIDGETIRWDAGFETGDRVPSNYDSMIAKLIVSGGDRDEAVDLLVETLTHTQLSGVPANTGFLRRCAQSDAFRDGTHHVNWIAEQGDALTHSPSEHQHASVLAVSDIQLDDAGAGMPWDIRDG
ncbi:MAG TPA: carbamoyl-phosphate synthase subunit L, partial [Hyphomonas atlantica]|nr:carbamoyl-phosphate synthase subunit L [Hyphomonas atlantica]